MLAVVKGEKLAMGFFGIVISIISVITVIGDIVEYYYCGLTGD